MYSDLIIIIIPEYFKHTFKCQSRGNNVFFDVICTCNGQHHVDHETFTISVEILDGVH